MNGSTGGYGPPPAPREPRRRAASFGIALILIGVIALIAQFIPGVAWWNLWPLIVVAFGLVRIFAPPRARDWRWEPVVDGIGTVLIGLILLGNTTGYLSWTVWWTLLLLWPVFIVALGVAILGKGLGQTWVRVLAAVLIWAALAYAVVADWSGARTPGAWPFVGRSDTRSSEPFQYSDTNVDVKEATLNLEGGLGEIAIEDGSGLVSASGRTPFGSPQFSVSRDGDSATVDVVMNEPSRPYVVGPLTSSTRATITLSDSILWNAVIQTGASNVDADLSNVQIRDLVLKTGASSVTLRLGEVPQDVNSSTLLVQSGVSSVKILVPADAEVKIEAQNGLSSTNVNGDFTRNGDTWTTPGYDSAEKVWNIRTETGVGSISISTY
ncbi:MAG: LiaF domain-containing protein [Coriobacteriia bacterium]